MLHPIQNVLYCLFIVALIATSKTQAQVFDSGPSDPALFTNGVFDVPAVTVPSSISDLQQLNLSDGGSINANFRVFSGGEVNISGGDVADSFWSRAGSEVNVSGGSIGDFFTAGSNSQVNISGGNFGLFFTANGLSEVNISGGNFSVLFEAAVGSEVNISGGTFSTIDARVGSNVQLLGGEFRLNGLAVNDPTLTTTAQDIFTGTLQDGSVLILVGGSLNNVTLTNVALPPLDPEPIVVDSTFPTGPSSLRNGQSLTLRSGGVLDQNFNAVDATLTIEGGTVGAGTGVYGSRVDIFDGTIGDSFVAFSGSLVNISGGNFGEFFTAFLGSQVNISDGNFDNFTAHDGSQVNISGGSFGMGFVARRDSEITISGGDFGNRNRFIADGNSQVTLIGSEFFLDGVPIDQLMAADDFTITDRNVRLSGTLADGSPLEFDLTTAFGTGGDTFSASAILNVRLAPQTQLGDVNLDDNVNFLDIAPFIAILSSGGFQLEADLNGDSSVNFLDIAPFIAVLSN